MTSTSTRIVWYDLFCTDPLRAIDFYSAVLGWKSHVLESDEMDYTIFRAGTREAGGLVRLPFDYQGHSYWCPHIQTEDAAALCTRVREQRGTVLLPPTHMSGLGTFAMFQDPQQIPLCVLQEPERASATTTETQPGQFSWNSILSHTPAPLLTFYTQVFGWQSSTQGTDDDPSWQFTSEGEPTASMLRIPMDEEEHEQPFWLPYVEVSSLAQTLQKAEQHGAVVLIPPQHSESLGQVAVIGDPVGAICGFREF